MNIETIKRLCPEFADLDLQPYLDDDALENVTDCVIGCQGLDNDAETMAEFIDLYAKAQTAKALAEARQAMEWRPIESAPKTGEKFLITNGKFALLAWHDGEGWVVLEDKSVVSITPFSKPTHWMPLPTPPSVKEGA